MFDDVVKLITETRTQNARGQYAVTETESEDILCEVASITRMEWDGAQQRGYDAEICLIIFFGDYNGQRIAKWNGERFEIYRHYQDGDRIELYLGRKVGV